MIIHGKVENGVVILPSDVSVPNGTEVSVHLPPSVEAADKDMTAAERTRILSIVAEIQAIPPQGPQDAFSGADHDQVLYGSHE